MVQYSSLADALEVEVLTQMADTFFGARKNLDDLMDAFKVHVEDLRANEKMVVAHALFIRSLFLGSEGEQQFYTALNVEAPFKHIPEHSAGHVWRSEHIPFAFFESTRYVKLVQLAYTRMYSACAEYASGVYEDDPDLKGRKRMTISYDFIVSLWDMLNTRVEKINREMAPSSVLQYARSIHNCEQNGQGALSCELGAQSLDDGLRYKMFTFESLNLWKPPTLPKPEACAENIAAFSRAFYAAHKNGIQHVLKALR